MRSAKKIIAAVFALGILMTGDRRPDRYHGGNSRIFGNIGR